MISEIKLNALSTLMLMTPPCIFQRRTTEPPTQQELNDSWRDAIGRLISDLLLISDWGSGNLVLFSASKTIFLQLSTRHNIPDNYHLFFNDTQLPLSSTLNTLNLSFTKYLNW